MLSIPPVWTALSGTAGMTDGSMFGLRGGEGKRPETAVWTQSSRGGECERTDRDRVERLSRPSRGRHQGIDAAAGPRRAGAAMIPVPSGVRVWLAVGRTDMRKGMNGLALQVQEALGRDPHAGDLYVFRGVRGDLMNITCS